MIKVCTDSLPEDNNWHFARGPLTDFYFPLGRHNYPVVPITQLKQLNLSWDLHWMRGVD